jgi:methionyl aminopeptidase
MAVLMTPSDVNRKSGRGSRLASRAPILTFGHCIQGLTMTQTDVVERKRSAEIPLHGPGAFEAMRRVGRMTAECLDMLTEHVKPGVTTDTLDRLAFEFIRDHGAYPACLHYRGYTKTVCTSINHVVCHGIPNDKPLRDGDIMNVDVTLILDGWHGDSSRMYYVGEVPRRAQRLCEITYECLLRGIAAVRPGATTNDIGAAIQSYAEAERCSVVRDFCGHGIGKIFHDSPTILHYVEPAYNVELKPGMFFTIEPMINLGRPQVKVLSDGWTAVTRDRSLSAQFEHMVGVTETGVEVFTFSPKGLDKPAATA